MVAWLTGWLHDFSWLSCGCGWLGGMLKQKAACRRVSSFSAEHADVYLLQALYRLPDALVRLLALMSLFSTFLFFCVLG